MTLKTLADDTVDELDRAFPDVSLSDEVRQKISRIVERTLIKAVQQTTVAHRNAATLGCGPEADLAHKINEQLELSNVSLTANLSALR